MTPGPDGATPSDTVRPTAVGPFGAVIPGTTKPRRVPAPWIDCPGCHWRHYPSIHSGRWHIATECEKCGGILDA